MDTTLGILVLNIEQEQQYYTAIAKAACHNQIETVIFSPEHILPGTTKVVGKKYIAHKHAWEEDTFDIPPFIYDRCFYRDEQKHKKIAPIVQWLKQNPDFTFLGYGLPNKWEVFNIISEHPTLSYYVPKTALASSTAAVTKQLQTQKRIILKPFKGSQGDGIIAISMKGKQIEIIVQRHNKTARQIISNKRHFYAWLDKLLQQNTYIIQPLLPLKDKDNCPFDIRILLQKNSENQWFEQGRGLRKGEAQGIISNLNGGGKVACYHKWAKTLTNKQRIVIEDSIDTIIDILPPLLEEKLGRLFELGIDIGVEHNGAVWLLDINSKPGHKVLLSTTPEKEQKIGAAPIEYLQFLQKEMVV